MIPIGWECAAEAGRELASYTGVSLAVQVEIQVTDLHWLALDRGNTTLSQRRPSLYVVSTPNPH